LRFSGCEIEDGDQGTQKRGEPAQEQGEVEAGGGEDGVDAVALAALELIAVHAVLGLDVADNGLDSGAALHLAADGGGDAPHLATDPDLELVGMVVPAIALIDMDAARLDAGELLHIGDHWAKGVAVEWVAMQGLRMQHELAALG
jgi:hypothetical protein